jgi:transcription antitermination factor NusG
LEPYLPLFRERRHWSDRVVESGQPLFPGYVFCRFDSKNRLAVITIPGVASVIRFGSEPASIPEQEIEAVRLILQSGLSAKPCPFLREGQRVRINGGALNGIEGILISKKRECRMVVSVAMLQRSVSVEISPEQITIV